MYIYPTVEAVSHLIFHLFVEGSVSLIPVRAMHSKRSWSSACFGPFVHPIDLAAEQKLTLVAFQTMTVFKTLVIKISVTTVLKCSLLKRESNVLNNLLKEEWNTSIIWRTSVWSIVYLRLSAFLSGLNLPRHHLKKLSKMEIVKVIK